jgi:hypothetical protein
MPTPAFYTAFAGRLREVLPLRNILIGAPFVLGLALFDNVWGQATYHLAGRLLTSLVILWIPITCIALLFAPKIPPGIKTKPVTWPRFKAAICTVVATLSIAFLVLVQTQPWQP